jgi:hypothetical protein
LPAAGRGTDTRKSDKGGEAAFKGCIKMSAIHLPNTLTRIDNKAFEDCSSLKEVILPRRLTVLGSEVLRGCSHIERILIPEHKTYNTNDGHNASCGLTKIGEEAMRHCRSLTSITLPESLQMIDSHAFRGCKMLASVDCLASTPPIAMPNAFAGVDMDLTTLYVPTDSIASYKASEGWNSFKNIRGRDDSDILV